MSESDVTNDAISAADQDFSNGVFRTISVVGTINPLPWQPDAEGILTGILGARVRLHKMLEPQYDDMECNDLFEMKYNGRMIELLEMKYGHGLYDRAWTAAKELFSSHI